MKIKTELTGNRVLECSKTRMTAIETRVGGLQTKFVEMETSCNFISKEYDSQKAELLQAKDHIKSLEIDCRKLETFIGTCEIQCENSKDDVLYLKARPTREKLVFYGVQEANEPEN